ncbi:hypothetical protein GKQ38_00535 [Candidatus Nanohaloarchaea archaeon]|nr:hypothetical protein GKQ38_00535 [Candidatus Nanohaloarchaea archaeon]
MALEDVKSEVLNDAEEKANSIVEEAEEEAEEIREEAQQEAEKIEERVEKEIEEEKESIKKKGLANARMKAKEKKLEAKQNALNNVFDEFRDELSEKVDDNQEEFVTSCVEKADFDVGKIQGSEGLEDAVESEGYDFEEIEDEGLVVVSEDGLKRLNFKLDKIVENYRENYRNQVAEKLFN